MIYLDNNATTRVADEVIDAMTPYYREFYGNPHSPHALGRRSFDAIEEARGQVARLLSAGDDEIYFTSCGTESNALVIRGILADQPRRGIVASTVEHPSVLALLRHLEERGTIDLRLIRVRRSGELDLDAAREAIDESTALVSIMLAQNETGVIHPVADVSRIAHERGAKVHVDGVQAAGKIPIDVRALDADFLSISGHKFHAPKGIGALFIRRGTKLAPLWHGGGQEYGMRSGTEAVPSIVGLGKAAELAMDHLPRQEQVRELRDRFEAAVRAGAEIASINGTGERLPNTSNICFRGLRSAQIVAMLDSKGICASGGSACQSAKPEPSAVMAAMGLTAEEAMGAVRFSLSRFTTANDIDDAFAATSAVIESLTSKMAGV